MRLRWPFRRRNSGASDAGTNTRPSVPEGPAWPGLPPLQRTIGPAPLVASTVEFATALVGHMGAPLASGALGHQFGLDAPRGVVVARAVSTDASRPGPELVASRMTARPRLHAPASAEQIRTAEPAVASDFPSVSVSRIVDVETTPSSVGDLVVSRSIDATSESTPDGVAAGLTGTPLALTDPRRLTALSTSVTSPATISFTRAPALTSDFMPPMGAIGPAVASSRIPGPSTSVPSVDAEGAGETAVQRTPAQSLAVAIPATTPPRRLTLGQSRRLRLGPPIEPKPTTLEATDLQLLPAGHDSSSFAPPPETPVVVDHVQRLVGRKTDAVLPAVDAQRSPSRSDRDDTSLRDDLGPSPDPEGGLAQRETSRSSLPSQANETVQRMAHGVPGVGTDGGSPELAGSLPQSPVSIEDQALASTGVSDRDLRFAGHPRGPSVEPIVVSRTVADVDPERPDAPRPDAGKTRPTASRAVGHEDPTAPPGVVISRSIAAMQRTVEPTGAPTVGLRPIVGRIEMGQVATPPRLRSNRRIDAQISVARQQAGVRAGDTDAWVGRQAGDSPGTPVAGSPSPLATHRAPVSRASTMVPLPIHRLVSTSSDFGSSVFQGVDSTVQTALRGAGPSMFTDGSVLRVPEPIPFSDPAEIASTPVVQRADEETSSEGPAAASTDAGVAGAASNPTSDKDLDDLARRLYERIRIRLRGELLVDRERAGLLIDLD